MLNKPTDLNVINERFNTLTSQQQQDGEVILARKGKGSLKEKIDEVDSQLAQTAKQTDLTTQKNRIDTIVTSASNYYIKCLSTDTGALLVVASGATTGQINLASVTPKLDTYTPIAGDYVRLVSQGLTAELVDMRVGAFGEMYGASGNSIRTVQNLLNYTYPKNMLDLTKMVSGVTLTTTGTESIDATKITSGFIQVTSGKTLNLTKGSGILQSVLIACFYDSAKKFKSVVYGSSFVVPEGATYFRFAINLSTYTSNSSTLQLEYGGATQYDQYFEPFYSMPAIKPKHRLIKCIAHQGYNKYMPNQTVLAYKAAAKHGFDFGECDIKITSDGIPVCCHSNIVYADDVNKRINQLLSTSNAIYNTAITITNSTLATLQSYDWGYWKSAELVGVTIPTFEDVLKTCKTYGIGLYIDNTYNLSLSQYQILFDIITKCGMKDNVVWLNPVWGSVYDWYPKAKSSLTASSYVSSLITDVKNLKTSYPNADICLNISYTGITESNVFDIRSQGIGIELWNINDSTSYLNWIPYVDVITSDNLIIDDVIN